MEDSGGPFKGGLQRFRVPVKSGKSHVGAMHHECIFHRHYVIWKAHGDDTTMAHHGDHGDQCDGNGDDDDDDDDEEHDEDEDEDEDEDDDKKITQLNGAFLAVATGCDAIARETTSSRAA